MYQSTTIVGNLGKDPEMRYTPSGQPVCSFSVATSRTYTGSNGAKVKETTWFRISAWGKLAEVCSQFLKKGKKVLVEGRLNSDPATGGPKVFSRQDGTSGSSFELTANTVRFLSAAEDGEHEGEPAPAAESAGDEIPF